MSRHVAESLLMHNGTDGTYLLRQSVTGLGLTVSARTTDAVVHFQVLWDGSRYLFGKAVLPSLRHLAAHLDGRPVCGLDSG